VTSELAAFGTATDPYQPIEGHYKITRASLEALTRSRTPIGLITKGPMIVRDIDDVLADFVPGDPLDRLHERPTVDEDAWRALEPGTAHPLQSASARCAS